MAANLDPCSSSDCRFDKRLHFFDSSIVDERATLDPFGQPFSDRDRTHRRRELRRELVDNPSLHEEAVGGRAGLR